MTLWSAGRLGAGGSRWHYALRPHRPTRPETRRPSARLCSPGPRCPEKGPLSDAWTWSWAPLAERAPAAPAAPPVRRATAVLGGWPAPGGKCPCPQLLTDPAPRNVPINNLSAPEQRAEMAVSCWLREVPSHLPLPTVAQGRSQEGGVWEADRAKSSVFRNSSSATSSVTRRQTPWPGKHQMCPLQVSRPGGASHCGSSLPSSQEQQ